jgi:DNA polymerase-4
MATILHVDMDAFFAAVEQLDNPRWRGKPLVVGAAPDERGVVSTCSYEARRFGVHSAMPSKCAYARCPHAIFVRPRMERYCEVSAVAFETFGTFTPYVEAVSIDEAFLDITGSVHLYGSARRLGEELRKAVRELCGVTCSVGIASNRLLAKIGSEENKPDGLTIMPDDPEEIAAFLAPKPVGAIWGIGKKTAELLRPYGITRCADLQRMESGRLATLLGSIEAARQLRERAFGISPAFVRHVPEPEKTVSREHTFACDESDRGRIREKLLELASDVARRLRTERRWARTARLKLRNAAFETTTRQAPFDNPVRDDISVRRKALELFEREKISSVRLVGFALSDICGSPDGDAPELFADEANERRKRNERLSDALDDLRRRGLTV